MTKERVCVLDEARRVCEECDELFKNHGLPNPKDQLSASFVLSMISIGELTSPTGGRQDK